MGRNAWLREKLELAAEIAADEAQRLRDVAARRAANAQGFKARMAAAKAALAAQQVSA